MTTPQQNGLVRWREQQQLEREWKLQRLAELRLEATEEVRGGKTFRVVRIPDSYDEARKETQSVRIQLRQPRRQLGR